MALSSLEQSTINKGITTAKLVVEQLKPMLDQLQVVFDSQGGVKSTVTQPNLDATPAYGGLTTTQLNDGMFALTATLKGAIDNAYAQLEELAARMG